MFFLSLLAGTRVSSWRAIEALRMRDSKSATGSVIMGSPARFRDARELAFESEQPRADAAQCEIAINTADTTANAAAIHGTSRELGRAIGFCPLRCARHISS